MESQEVVRTKYVVVTPPAAPVLWRTCTTPEDADTMISVPVVPTVNVPPDVATTTKGDELRVTVPDVIVVADAVTVGTLDRLNTVESVTGIVPPDVATITSGAELSVNVPDEMAMADERVTVPDDRDRMRNPDDAVSTVGFPLICTSPDEALRTVTVLTTFTAVVAAFVTVTAVLGLLIATNTPPEVVTGP